MDAILETIYSSVFFFCENCCILIWILLKSFPMLQLTSQYFLRKCCQTGEKPWSEKWWPRVLSHICVTRWLNAYTWRAKWWQISTRKFQVYLLESAFWRNVYEYCLIGFIDDNSTLIPRCRVIVKFNKYLILQSTHIYIYIYMRLWTSMYSSAI